MEASSPPSAGWYDFVGWLDTNRSRVAMGAGVVAFIAILVGFWAWRGSQREIEAAKAFTSVSAPFGPSGQPAPGIAEAYLKVVDEYPKTKAAGKALLRAGNAYFDQGDYAKAQEQFQKLLRNYSESGWAPQAVFCVAACLEAQSKTTDAISRYADFISKYPNDPATELARFNLARLYDQTQQPALALDVLKRMADPQAPGLGTQEAQEKIRELYAKYPSLIPSNPAPPAPAPTVITNIVRPPVNPAQTNVINLTNLIRQTNPPVILTGAPPKILLSPGNTTAGK